MSRATARRATRRSAPMHGAAADPALSALVARTRLELVPLRSLDAVQGELPPGIPLSVTCSPTRGLLATLELTAQLVDRGHDVVPHLSARLVENRDHVAKLATWIREHGIREVFVVAGDVTSPRGPYEDGHSLLAALFEHDTGLEVVGLPAYPDGHPLIDADDLRRVLHAKQDLIIAAGCTGSVTTQMCFDATRIRQWLSDERAAGLRFAVDLGIPGAVDTVKLVSMGVRLGVGASLRYVRKNRSLISSMTTRRRHDPTPLVAALAPDADRLGIDGLHAFTFNQVAPTVAWMRAIRST